MKAEELAVIKERAEKATGGPWVADGSYGGVHTQNPDYQDVSRSWSGSHNGICNIWDGEYIENSNRQGDAEFIAHAHQDVPKLVAEVEWLHSVIWRISDYCDMSIEETQVFLNEVDDE